MEALERGREVHMIFLDISNAFDKVWFKGLLFKLERLGIRDPLLSWIKSYLTNRKRVVFDGNMSDSKDVEAGEPQGSVLGPLLFLVYINDITDNIQSTRFLYADDTQSLLEIVEDPQLTSAKLNSDLTNISKWTRDWLVTINPSKIEAVIFSTKRYINQYIQLYIMKIMKLILSIVIIDHLGVTLSSNMSWRTHILNIHDKASKRLNLLQGLN
jgi:hypothetical protein